jgi:hypothetical protein
MQQSPLRGRALIALVTLLSFAVLAVSGVILFLVPGGRHGAAAGWPMIGLDRRQWEDLHICFALLAVGVTVVHVWLNRRALAGYLRRNAAALVLPGLGLRLELVVAAALCLLLGVATVRQVPPVSYLSQLQHDMRGSRESAPPPFAPGRHGWQNAE